MNRRSLQPERLRRSRSGVTLNGATARVFVVCVVFAVTSCCASVALADENAAPLGDVTTSSAFADDDSTTRNDPADDATPQPPPKLTWEGFMHNMTTSFGTVLHKIFPLMVRASSEVEIGPECMASYFKLFLGLRKLKGWAVRLVDATGKPADGLLEGTMAFVGAFDECLDTVVWDEHDSSRLVFRGRYCTAQVAPKFTLRDLFHNESQAHNELATYLPKKAMLKNALRIPGNHVIFRVGLCVPSTCSKDDIERMVKYTVKQMDMKAEVTECLQRDENKPLSVIQITVITLLAAFLSLTIIGTVTDITIKERRHPKAPASEKHGRPLEALLCFSAYSNARKLFAPEDKPDSLRALHGIRFLSMTWIIFGHSYFFIEHVQPFRGLFNGHEMYSDNFFFSGVINFTLAVDSFFFISGLLVVYTNWKELTESNGRLNVIRFLFNKYWRMMPPLLLSLGLLFLMPVLGDGPFWNDIMGTEIRLCEKSWWSNLLLINNFWDSKEMCLVATWYLACNFQFFVLSIFILIPLYNWPTVGLTATFLLLLAGSIVSGVITFMSDLPPGLIFYPDLDTVSNLVTYVYHKPYNHIGSYCVGVFLGYVIVRHRDIKLKPLTQVIGWCTSFSVGVAVLWAAYRWNAELPSAPVAALYAATHRVAWCIALAWLTFACVAGHGGFLDSLLSWPPFNALGNLAFMAYLMHPLVILYHSSRTRDLIYYSQYEKVYAFCGHFLITLVLSTFFYVIVEMPFTRVGAMLLRTRLFRKPSRRPGAVSGGGTESGPGVRKPSRPASAIVADIARGVTPLAFIKARAHGTARRSGSAQAAELSATPDCGRPTNGRFRKTGDSSHL
ncbi:nose resistant to fluoxetine protein 6 isoform X1 [Rhipicephalus sanguineus]|uniref:nose resistant to fluoxetine protein 6 isoform X1 n=2 Tax=Rhipicephalus sanguineus TaxID=34632 RepID=UPI0018947EED|nr:nose resistant to fluoxetine protein 6 isoform X1 [Rhipicephalus sanguineus]